MSESRRGWDEKDIIDYIENHGTSLDKKIYLTKTPEQDNRENPDTIKTQQEYRDYGYSRNH